MEILGTELTENGARRARLRIAQDLRYGGIGYVAGESTGPMENVTLEAGDVHRRTQVLPLEAINISLLSVSGGGPTRPTIKL